MNKTVTGCIVTYNNIATIDNAVSSLLNCTEADFRLFIVDNGSTDGTPEHIEKNYPQVRVIRSGGNIGFGAGHNLVLDMLDSDYHAIINPDISVRDEVRFPDGRPQILGKKNPCLKYLFASHFRKSGSPEETLREYAMLDSDYSKPFEIENATGCFMFIRTELFRKLGGFDKTMLIVYSISVMYCVSSPRTPAAAAAETSSA